MALPTALYLIVFANQLKVGRTMIKGRPWIKLNRRVTGRTGFFLSRFLELIFVRRRMTVDTKVLCRAWELIHFLTLDLVTGLAGELHMRACKRKTGLVMEGRIRSDLPLHVLNIPAFRRMALGAGNRFKSFMERCRMRRLVTGLTGLGRYGFKEIAAQGIRCRFKAGAA